MPHAKRQINPLWALLSEPLFQIIAAVGLLLSGVLGLVGKFLNQLGLGGLLNSLLGGLGIDRLLEGLGLGTVTESLGLDGESAFHALLGSLMFQAYQFLLLVFNAVFGSSKDHF